MEHSVKRLVLKFEGLFLTKKGKSLQKVEWTYKKNVA
jgi:hypothetical protein